VFFFKSRVRNYAVVQCDNSKQSINFPMEMPYQWADKNLILFVFFQSLPLYILFLFFIVYYILYSLFYLVCIPSLVNRFFLCILFVVSCCYIFCCITCSLHIPCSVMCVLRFLLFTVCCNYCLCCIFCTVYLFHCLLLHIFFILSFIASACRCFIVYLHFLCCIHCSCVFSLIYRLFS
jgi:hypothetical protein